MATHNVGKEKDEIEKENLSLHVPLLGFRSQEKKNFYWTNKNTQYADRQNPQKKTKGNASERRCKKNMALKREWKEKKKTTVNIRSGLTSSWPSLFF